MNPRAGTGTSSRHNGERCLLRLRNRSAQSCACASSPPRRARECSKAATRPRMRTAHQAVTPDPTSHAWQFPQRLLTLLANLPNEKKPAAITSKLPVIGPNSAKTMLKQAALIAFASSAAMALQPSNLQALQRGLHTRLAASSRRKTSFRAPPQHDVSRAGS